MSAKKVMADDSISDDVFESESETKLRASSADPRSGRPTPSPTGYRDYTPDPQLLTPIRQVEPDIAHKTILLGDSGVGKTSLLVQFDTGKFQAGSFSATVGIGFTGQTFALVPRIGTGRWLGLGESAGSRLHGNGFTPVSPDTQIPNRFSVSWCFLPDQVTTISYDKGERLGNEEEEIVNKNIEMDERLNQRRQSKSSEEPGMEEREREATPTRKIVPQWSQYSHQHHQHNYQNGEPPMPRVPRHSITTETCDLVCKVMLLGDSGVGKTCILVRFRDNMFLSGNFISTVGIDFRNKVVSVDETKVKLQIWDTAGQERFRSVTHAYYRDAHALLLLYDVTNKNSFDNIRAWLSEIKEYAQDDVVIMLLGNKCDCQSSERMVRREDGERIARENTVAFMETSAKTGQNVDLAFMAIARELKARKNGTHNRSSFNVQEYVREQTSRASCPPCSS